MDDNGQFSATGFNTVDTDKIEANDNASGNNFMVSEDNTVDLWIYPGLTKEVRTGVEGNEPTWGENATAAAGDEVTFKLTSNVPEDLLNYIKADPAEEGKVVEIMPLTNDDNDNSGEYLLTFHDELPAQLSLDGDSFTVMLGGNEIAEANYTVVIGPDKRLTDSCTFEVLIDLAALEESGIITDKDIDNTTPITVTYKATLKDDVTAGQYTNTAWVSYPGDETEKDTATVTTYAISIYKYDQTDETKGLYGAKFALYGSDAVDEDGTLKPDAAPIDKGEIMSDLEGMAQINGLDAGTYYLVETEAPDGYVCSDTPVKVILPDNADGTTYLAKVKFANSAVPHTGGTGTLMYTIGGIAIIVLAGVLLIVYRKSRKKQER